MRLTFPNGEHAAVNIEQGQVGVGSAAGGGTSVAIDGLSPLHAVFAHGRRGSWLTVPQEATVVVNARPVKRIAYLRPGDLVCLGSVQVRVESGEPPAPAPPVEASPRRRGGDEPNGAARAVLRGLSGAWFGRTAALSSQRMLGRGPGSDIRLEGGGVQERHALVDIEDGHVVVRVATTGAALRVNGHLVASALLAAGDQLEIGEHRFSVEAPGLASSNEATSTPAPGRREASTPTSMPSVRVPTAPESSGPVRRDLSGVYLLIAAAAALAAALTAFFVYAPRG
jgi:pSer/pThr/pTyr-binding forkhead associated (FHA) protein